MQPEKSGHYIFTFVAISDKNYPKVGLKGPSIEQIVHPLASADFAESVSRHRTKTASSCTGDTVPVDVDLKVYPFYCRSMSPYLMTRPQGTGPWNLEFQIIGPKSSETFRVTGITTPRHRAQIPIPKDLQKTGGAFEINLSTSML